MAAATGVAATVRNAAFGFERRLLDRYLDDAGYASGSLRTCWAAMAAASSGFADYHWWTLRPAASENEVLASVRCTGYLTAAPAPVPWSLLCADDGDGPLDGEWAVVLSAGGGHPTELLRIVDHTPQAVPVTTKRWRAPAVSWLPAPRPSIEPNSPWRRLWSPGDWRDVNTWTTQPPENLVRLAYAGTPAVVARWAAFVASADLAERGACPEVGALVLDPTADARYAADAVGVVVGAGLVRTWSARTNGWYTALWTDQPKLRAVLPTVQGRAV